MSLYSAIDNWLSNISFHEVKRESFKEKAIDSELGKQASAIFDGLDSMISENPQKLVDLTRNKMIHNQDVMFLVKAMFNNRKREGGEHDNIGVLSKVKSLSVFWESSTLLRLPAYLLYKGKIDIDKFEKKEQILKHFKFIGITGREISTIRQIRNAEYHPSNFRNGVLINDKGKEVA